jgi:outer membrane immunogenic protein
MITKTILTGAVTAAIMALAPVAQAADMPAPYKAPAYVEPAYAGWTGFYFGINGGYGFGSSDWDFPALSTDPSGAFVGGTLGYNMQTGSLVWGIEGDFDWSWMKGDTACAPGTCETSNDWIGTARLRLGYAGWSNWLPYITGGAAFADVEANASPLGTSAGKTMLGWTVGAGLEYAWVANWSFKVEYLYADLGSFDCGTSCGAVTDDVNFKTNLVRLGLNYRF